MRPSLRQISSFAIAITAAAAIAPFASVSAQAQTPARPKLPAPAPPVFKRYNLRCLAPLLKDLDPDAPETLEQALLAGPTGRALPAEGDTADAGIGSGAVHFPITSEAPGAQGLFNQGLALLHTLWYREAERAFRSVVHLDPDCAMGYWGLAMANELQPGRARLFARTAVDKVNANHPKRERLWIDILARFYNIREDAGRAIAPTAGRPDSASDLTARSARRIRSLEDLVIDFPEDIEAKAFLVRQLTLDEYRAGVPITAHLGVERLAADLAAAAPAHPSRHYPVFLWLARRPERGLGHADAAPPLSPAVAEVWRYAGEAYSAAGRALDAVPLYEAALRVDHRFMEERLRMPWETQNLAANYEVLIDTLSSMGRIDDALTWARRASKLPRAPASFEGLASPDPAADFPAMGRRLYLETLVRGELWERILDEVESGPLFQSAESFDDRAPLLFWKGVAHLFLDRTEKAAAARKALDELLVAALRQGVTNRTEAAIAAAAGALDTCLRLLESETPAPLDGEKIPALITPELLVLLYDRAGLTTEAARLSRAAAEAQPDRILPAAYHCSLAFENGNHRDAFLQLNRRFRVNAAFADAALPALRRLDPVAREMQLPDPWTLPFHAAPSAALPSDPDSLGPAAWTPTPAPDFSLPDHTGRTRGLADFKGKAVIFNFFFGVSCAYCVEQLNLFKPHLEAFRDAGIEFVAVGTDPLEMLQHTFGDQPEKKNGLEEEFPFVVLADPDLTAFKAFGAFDEFENGPLHATVLLDAKGRVLWADRGHAPFNQPEALLREARRMLALSQAD